MPVTDQDKPLDALRNEVIDQLVLNYGHGKLSLEAFERRLDRALEARTHAALSALTEDLDLGADAGAASARPAAREPVEPGRPMPDDRLAAQPKDVEHMIHVFGASNRRGPWTVAKEIHLLNVFGSADLDFSEARFSARTTRIRMLCLFGAANLYVPEGVNAISKALCLFGSLDNRAASENAAGPTLIVEGVLLFGSATVKLKKTLKKRLLEAAETLRGLFGHPHAGGGPG